VIRRRLAATTAAAFLCAYACQVYDESDLAGPDEAEVPTTGGRAPTGGATFIPMPNAGSGGRVAGGGTSALGGSGGRGGAAPGPNGGSIAAGGRGGSAPASGGDSGAPGAAGEPATGGTENMGGAPEPGGGSPALGGGGTTGGSETGGSSTGGTPVAPELIDDGEDGNNRIRLNEGRNGYWSTFGPAACSVSPTNTMATRFMTAVSGESGTGDFALHFTSKGGADDSCGVGFDLVNPKDIYDGSAYSGISFGARSDAGEQTVYVKISTAGTDPAFDECDPDAAIDSPEQCYDHYFAEIALDDTYREYTVAFTDLIQEGWGFEPPHGFDATEIVGVQWVAKPGTANIWIDDVMFVE